MDSGHPSIALHLLRREARPLPPGGIEVLPASVFARHPDQCRNGVSQCRKSSLAIRAPRLNLANTCHVMKQKYGTGNRTAVFSHQGCTDENRYASAIRRNKGCSFRAWTSSNEPQCLMYRRRQCVTCFFIDHPKEFIDDLATSLHRRNACNALTGGIKKGHDTVIVRDQ
jgi:hypothetical protein